MADDCCNKLMKYLLITINLVFFIAGLCLAGIAGYGAINHKSPIHNVAVGLHDYSVLNGLYIMMAAGLFLALLSVLGCFAAGLENRFTLGIYFFLLLILFILELVAVILCFVKYKKVKQTLVDSLKTGGESNDVHIILAHAVLTQILPAIQTKYQCCGLKGPTDYGSHIPHSCYAPVHVSVVPHNKTHSMSDADTPGEGNSELGATSVEHAPVGGNSALTNIGNANILSSTTSRIGSLAPRISARSTTRLTTSPSAKFEATSEMLASTDAVHAIATDSSKTTSVSFTTVPSAAVLTTERSLQTSVVSGTIKETQSTTSLARNETTTEIPGAAFIHGGLYGKGCLSMLKPQIYAAGGLAIALLVLDVLALMFAGCLIAANKDGYIGIA